MPSAESVLVIRPWKLSDLEDAFVIYSDPNVMRWLGNGAVVPSLPDMEERLSKLIARQDEEGDIGYYAVLVNGETRVIGGAICKVIPHSETHLDLPEETEIGWHLAADQWGKGYGTQIGAAMMERAWEKVDSIVAVAYSDNAPSIRIMQKIGMQAQGKTDRFYNIPGLTLYTADRPTG